MKVIDLLNKISDGEISKEVKLFKQLKDCCIYSLEDLYCSLQDEDVYLGDEIEIIEEDKPIEKILLNYQDGHSQEEINEYLRCEINELIEEVNKLKKESDR